MFENPFSGSILGEISQSTNFMLLYYLPKGDTAASQTTTGNTYYTYWVQDDMVTTARAYGLWAYKSRNRGRPVSFTYSKASNGFEFRGQQIYNYLNTNQEESGDKYMLLNTENTEQVPSDEKACILVKNGVSQVYQLEQANTNVPTDVLYSGVWYRMYSNGHKVVPYCYDLPAEIGTNPFPNEKDPVISEDHNSFLQIPLVMFVPIKISYYNKGTCTPPLTNSLSVLLIADWINTVATSGYVSHYKQLHCSSRYGTNSQWCANTGDTCNNNIGYSYCKTGSSCGQCFGACSGGGGGSCVVAEKGKTFAFYCANNGGGGGSSSTVKPKHSEEIKTFLMYAGIAGGSLILLIAGFRLVISDRRDRS